MPADEQLRAAARGDLTRLGQISIELESQLRPREIQARIRAGASVDQVAAAAGVPAQKIERFAYPVLLERSRTAEVAQRAHPMRADGPDSRMLGDVVAHTFGLRGQEYPSAEWDSWKGDDGRWVVALSWRAGRSDNRALWTFQPGAHGGTVTAIDEHAHDLVEGLPARPLRTVGPVIDISRPDEQPPPAPEEGHELRAAASDIAARRDVSDWSRVAPEPRRPEPRRQATRAEPAEPQQREPNVRPNRADEPATEWPAPERQSESAGQGDATTRPGARRDEPVTDDGQPRVGAAGGDDPTGVAVRRQRPTRPTRAVRPRQAPGPTRAARPRHPLRRAAHRLRTTGGGAHRDAGGTASAARTPAAGAPAAAARTRQPGRDGRSADGRRASAVRPAPHGGHGPNGRPPAGARRGETAVPSARSPQTEPAEQHGHETGVDEGAQPDQAEPPAPRQAEPGPQATKRGRKGKPVMPSWDEVLLGVRSQR